MTKVFIVFLFCLLLLNCSKKEEVQKINAYIISKEDIKISNELKKKKIPPPPKGFYGEIQLVIDKKGNLYYYQKEYIQILCSYGAEKDTLPYFLDLKPKHIVRVPQKSLNDFLSENILTKEKRRQILIIASQTDTIANNDLLEFINKKLNIYFIRRTTQEEDTVLKYKIDDKYYDFEYVKWDKTKIKFPDYIKLNTHSN
ncbi:hypothetical protein GKZ90_0008055 [Flavobacterium sp. MC2016-06]|jgi:hypothetical protein|uniref:hypothetical protein n=1 Tax=Flavobacterium sp. MC2016-06 TaxID=2676308 RepID=UPI0012BAACEF|nr:hypothetical protein [Flavobacterium sp. MC2016-06]MBU3858016.1 hypothetical protein [Flavobacterium sp. MC2016-06]